MAKSPHLSRNDFVKAMVATLGTIIGVVVGLPAIAYLISPAVKSQSTDAWVSLGPLENYPVSIPTLFSFTRTKINGWEKTVNSFGVYVYRETESQVVVYSNVCTHLSCRVTWEEGDEIYFCPCHDGIFDKDGKVVTGPPPRPMDRYETKVDDGVLSIRVVEG
jgi:Rieske Fe-S protein